MSKRKFLTLFILVLGLTLLATAAWAAPVGKGMAAPGPDADPPAKHLAAPPGEIRAGSWQLPEPAANGIDSHSAMIPVELMRAADGSATWQSEISVDAAKNLSLMVFAPEVGAWEVRVQPAGSSRLSLADSPAVQREVAAIGAGNTRYLGERFTFSRAATGPWQVEIQAGAEQIGQKGYLVMSADTPYHLFAHLASYDLHAGATVGLVAYVYESGEGAPAAATGLVDTAAVTVQLPDGSERVLPMADDGRHQDGAAGDGVYGALISADTAGEYSAQVAVEGQTPTGEPFIRTSEHVFPVVEPALQLLPGTARTQVLDDERLQIELRARALAGTVGDVKAFAEVWGTGPEGEMVPVAGIGGVVTPEQRGNSLTLPLQLDARWIALAGAEAPFELRNVRVQDLTTHIPLSRLEAAGLDTLRLPRAAHGRVNRITEEMLQGRRPAPAQAARGPNAATNGGKLLLVHGYCSEGSWPTSHFTDYAVFQDYNQNRTHDEFARLIGSFGSQFPSFGIVAHSQGGAASLHLYTYYWSGLDYSSGSRLIQSVGTPYQGTALAGNLAALGDVFGAGCGTNWDLTYDGASLWLSGIPSWARSRVYYHTTSFRDRWWAYDYCNFATDLFLSDPDDGVIEKWAGQLSGANNMGHKSGWCHTTSMRDPGQTTDYSRNSTMNYYANR